VWSGTQGRAAGSKSSAPVAALGLLDEVPIDRRPSAAPIGDACRRY